jgi:hypothetical protein
MAADSITRLSYVPGSEIQGQKPIACRIAEICLRPLANTCANIFANTLVTYQPQGGFLILVRLARSGKSEAVCVTNDIGTIQPTQRYTLFTRIPHEFER